MTDNALTKLDRATTMLAEARTLDEVKHIVDIAEAARTYARAAKLGLEAANHAAEIKIRAERKAGELLLRLERSPISRNPKAFQDGMPSEYREVLEDQAIPTTTAHRWQTVAAIPENKFEQHIAEVIETGGELTTAGLLKIAKAPHVAQNTGESEWYTPPEYIACARAVMGRIDLDPASSEIANKVVGASMFYTREEDGLQRYWAGKVWLNPPYSTELIHPFVEKYVQHVTNGDINEGIVLVNNATETNWFNDLVSVSNAIVFPNGRVRFLDPDGNPGAPLQGQAVIYTGQNPEKFMQEFGEFGWSARLC